MTCKWYIWVGLGWVGLGWVGSGQVVLINMRETPTGYVATTLKDSDQVSTQTFNDVGPMDEADAIASVDRKEAK